MYTEYTHNNSTMWFIDMIYLQVQDVDMSSLVSIMIQSVKRRL